MNLDSHLKEEVKKFLLKKMREEDEIMTVISAHPLTKSQESTLKELIPESKKEMNTQIDKSLIAGIIVRKGSRILDMSIKGRLLDIQNSLAS